MLLHFYHWLHYSPSKSETVGWEGQRTRFMNVPCWLNSQKCAIIVEQSKRNFIHSSTLLDRRSFQVILRCAEPMSAFQIENFNTNEVLQLESGPENLLFQIMILRRCLMSDLSIARQFFRETFDEKGYYLTSETSERSCLVIT